MARSTNMILHVSVNAGTSFETICDTLATIGVRVVDPEDYAQCRWRTGSKIHRTVYAQRGPEPDYRDPAEGGDPLVGLFDTADLATEAVDSHNEWISIREPGEHSMTENRFTQDDVNTLLGVVKPPEPVDRTDYTDPDNYMTPDPRDLRACLGCGLVIADMSAADLHRTFHDLLERCPR